MLVTSTLICEYGHQMALNFRFKSSFYCSFGRPIGFQGQMDPRTPPRGRKLGSLLAKIEQKAPQKTERPQTLG